MILFAKRNLKLFFRDKSAVFFSLLAVLIVMGLYAFFLGDQLVSGFDDIDGVKIKGAKFLMDSWLIAGILAVTSISTTLGAFGVIVDDKVKKIDKDFRCSPVSRSSLAGGYIISSFVIGVIMSIIAFAVGEIYIVVSGGEILPLNSILKVLGMILLTVLAGSSIMFFVVSFFNSNNAFATASTVIGTLIGFITGIYLPVGSMPDGVAMVVKIFPISHAASVFRKIFMEVPFEKSFDGVPDIISNSAIPAIKEEFGVDFKIGSWEVSTFDSILILIATSILFYILGIAVISRKKR